MCNNLYVSGELVFSHQGGKQPFSQTEENVYKELGQ